MQSQRQSKIFCLQFCITTSVFTAAIKVVKTGRCCRILLPFRHTPNQYPGLKFLVDLTMVTDHGHYLIFNIDTPRNIQISTRMKGFVRHWLEESPQSLELLIIFDLSKYVCYTQQWMALHDYRVETTHLKYVCKGTGQNIDEFQCAENSKHYQRKGK